MGGTDSAPNIVELPKRFHATLHMMMANLPPHLGLLLVLSWSEYDQRTYERHEKLREDIYDLYRDLGRGRTELEDIYNPKTLHGIAGKPQDGGKNPRVKEDGLRILRNSLRIGRDW